jgi:hypothetical protein
MQMNHVKTFIRRPSAALVAILVGVVALPHFDQAEAQTESRDCRLARASGAPLPPNCRRTGTTTPTPTPRPRPRKPDPSGPIYVSPVPSPVPPPIYQPPVGQRDTVILAPSGGDATTLQQAYNMVREGGTIRIRQGGYYASMTIDKSVRLIGETANGQDPFIYGPSNPLRIRSGNVTIQQLYVESNESGNALQIDGGTVYIRLSHIRSPNAVGSARRIDRADNSALWIAGGSVTIVDSIVGPGYSQGIAVAGPGSLNISTSTLRGPAAGIFAFERANVTINANRFETPTQSFAMVMRSGAIFSITNNRFTYSTNTTWLCVDRTSESGSATGNADNNNVFYTSREYCGPVTTP